MRLCDSPVRLNWKIIWAEKDGAEKLGIIEETDSDTIGLMVGIDGILSDSLMGKIFLEKG